jgi:hypothetical protein
MEEVESRRAHPRHPLTSDPVSVEHRSVLRRADFASRIISALPVIGLRDTVPLGGLWRQAMKASWLYRIAAILLLLFAAGHTFGFRQNNPEWGAGAVLALMRSVHFDAQGFTRTYWDFFSAFGLFFSVFLLFSAVLAWQLGGLPAEILARLRSIAWALAICFVAITALSWRYAFTIPIVFSALVTVLLLAAAWLSAKKTV